MSVTRPLLLCAAFAATIMPLAAHAVDVEVAPAVGFRLGGQFHDQTNDKDVDVKESIAYGVAIDVEYSPDQMIELYYSRQPTEIQDANPSIDLDVEYLHIGGVAEFPQDNYTPYAVGTIGATRFSPSGGLDDETRFSLSLGGGVKWFFNEHFALKFEGRAYVTIFDSDTDIFCVSNGGAVCRFHTTGSAVFQLEAQAGVAYRF